MDNTFHTDLIADVSTVHITERDGELLGSWQAPGHLACIDGEDSPGDVFWVPQMPELMKELKRELKDFGFSRFFIGIFRELHRRKIRYVRFDRDGEQYSWLPEFDW